MTNFKFSCVKGKENMGVRGNMDITPRSGDLPPLFARHRGHGQQYFDSADWSMYKDDKEKHNQLSKLPIMSVERRTRMTNRTTRKSTLSCDSARSLTPKHQKSMNGQ